MNSWNDIVLGLCLVLLSGLLWKEWRRPNRLRLFWRCVAAVLAVGALACLGLPIGYWREGAPVRPVERSDSARLQGVVTVDWQRRLFSGDSLQVRGRWVGPAGKLVLVGMGSALDSFLVTGDGDFSFGVLPAQMGRAIYKLVAVVGKDTVEQEEVPVDVQAGAPLKILLLAASPDFENRFLLKWLGEEGNVVASRTIVSRDKVEEAFVNRGASVLSPLGSTVLAGFDLVVADAAALPVKGSAGFVALRQEIGRRGMGLLLKVDSAGLDSMIRVMLRHPSGSPGGVLLRDSNGHVTAGVMMEGVGKVVFTLLDKSYGRLLAGERAAYAGYWSKLLREGRPRSGEEWSYEPVLRRVGEEVGVRLQTDNALPVGVIGGSTVYMAQDAALPFVWRGRYWPEKPGWQVAYRPMGDTSWWYVWPVGSWKGMKRVQLSREPMGNVEVKRVRMEFPKVWFWGLFLLSTAFLWVERKMGGMNG